MELTAIIEALLIASEEPLSSTELARLVRARIAEADDLLSVENDKASADKSGVAKPDPATLPDYLARLARTDENAITAAIAQLNHSYMTTGRSFLCIERAKGWKIFTQPEYADFVRQLYPDRKPSRLSGPAMETLAIIAYRQPIAKASIEAVRGVSCDGMLQKLLDRELIKIGGRADLPGRPLLYETTDLFFEHFGVKSIDDLPNANELRTVKLPEAGLSQQAEENPQGIEQQLALTAAGLPSTHAEGSEIEIHYDASGSDKSAQ
ncbi:MAG: SMC-Scp complex subunit ScpB [Akkermansiaceae bacterium]